MVCCQLYEPEQAAELQADYEEGQFDCDTCELRCARAKLSLHDRDTIELHRLLNLPVVRDLGLTRLVFEVHQPLATADEAEALLDKLQVVHEFVQAPPERPLKQPTRPDPDRDDDEE